MPSPSRKAKIAGGVARFVAGLRSKRTGGSLVVQPGFPTSLADLIVKNHSRLKKPSRKLRRLPLVSDDSIVAVRSPFHSQDRPRASCSGPLSRVTSEPVFSGTDSPIIAVRSLSDRQDLALSARVLIEPRIRRRDCRAWVVAAKVAPLVAVTLGEKGFVIGITIAALILWVLELIGAPVFSSLMTCQAKERVQSLDLDSKERVSPIREIRVFERAESTELLVEREEVPFNEKEGNLESLKMQKRRKKLWKKLVPKKLRGRKDEQDPVDREEMVVEEDKEEEEDEDKDIDIEDSDMIQEEKKGESCNENSQFDAVVEDSIAEAPGLENSRLLLPLVAIVLLGLVGGKMVALLLISGSFVICKSLQSTEREWKMDGSCSGS